MSSASTQNPFRLKCRSEPRTWQPDSFATGQLVVVQQTAGPRLGGKQGRVLGIGATRTRIRVQLDSSKGPITLHARFLDRACAEPGTAVANP
jgi:hypothetical protein